MIPYEAVAAANKALCIASDGLTIQETVKIVLEAAAPHMLADKTNQDEPNDGRNHE